MKYNPDQITPDVIAQEVNSLGFTAEYLPEASSGGGTVLELKVTQWGEDRGESSRVFLYPFKLV